jgi:hypothetical protein
LWFFSTNESISSIGGPYFDKPNIHLRREYRKAWDLPRARAARKILVEPRDRARTGHSPPALVRILKRPDLPASAGV